MRQFTVLNLLVLVGVLGVGMAAMRSGSEWAGKAAFTVMLATLAIALLGAIVRRGSAPWVGFALFGWGYAALVFVPLVNNQYHAFLLTPPLLDQFVERLYEIPAEPESPGFQLSMRSSDTYNGKRVNGSVVPLTADEEHIAQDFVAKLHDRLQRTYELHSRITFATNIGHSCLALTFGLIGAGVGRFLATWRMPRRAPVSTNPGFTTETSPLTS